ncbi:hypothetical protein G7B40_029495 [Aetokthonos hydrillicola Thurmond2011]|jgi:hypothetical protein|uniref:Uncharacterized protein n=1 Tax=Aetokthonos hydrillicola Thurmond2011 TaxID=2712845 RepID=A0AAP5IFG8_9CYAN|nr:hypothetical protein [Aetokthonos hydrillicola]MBO3462509.1 hypothetical protein [Aetokthonos hydrillicola CCALA 1050]MBW4587472.1 hypothetical protein [Aetokthonos hydrillicola CCALA 1050]MDR9898663.1 hypothetical protein [Aetokthonos hydrillicola Thurmond2011]
MKISRFLLVIILCLSLVVVVSPLQAQEAQNTVTTANQTIPGAGNADATRIARKSPLVQSAQNFLAQQIDQIQDSALRQATRDAVNNTKTCITHRAGLNNSQKQKILQQLKDEGLVDTSSDGTFPGGLIAGVFPPVLEDGSACPQLPQPFFAAPGSSNNSHHAYPGGLPVHEAFNNLSDLSFADNYRSIYGQSRSDGLPIINPSADNKRNSDIYLNNDLLSAAPIWHDWAKPIVFQWNSDGTEFQELSFGGNGKTDNYGASGDSRTGGHHIIGLAESMKRGLSPEFVITQASAHSAPTLGNEYKVVNWLRTAGILAQIDPVEKGYLFQDNQKRLRLPPVRKLGSYNLTGSNSSQTNLLAEYALHNLSDADFVLSIPAVTIDQELLSAIAPQFGYNPTDTATYIKQFRNPVLTYLSAERLLIIYGNSGLDGVIAEVSKLSKKKII